MMSATLCSHGFLQDHLEECLRPERQGDGRCSNSMSLPLKYAKNLSNNSHKLSEHIIFFEIFKYEMTSFLKNLPKVTKDLAI